jgi:hypothetical protein
VNTERLAKALSEMSAFVDEHSQIWAAENPPRELFHYTSPEGFIGIVTSKSLWASDMLSLNDASEAAYPYKLIADVLDTHHLSVPEKHRQGFKTQLINGTFPLYVPFVVCFCEDGDLLSQWRAYGSGGEGFSPAFKFSWLSSLDQKAGFRLQKVVYDRTQQEELILMLLQRASSLLAQDAFSDEEQATIWQGAAMSLAPWVIMFKDPAFKEEREWRLVNVNLARATGFRRSGHRIVQYLSVGIDDPEAITRVIRGPYFTGTEIRGVYYLMTSHGFVLGSTIQDSSIPLRR